MKVLRIYTIVNPTMNNPTNLNRTDNDGQTHLHSYHKHYNDDKKEAYYLFT